MSTRGPVTRDKFLGGRLEVLQPRDGYRAGTDPVFLAACVPAARGESVFEPGCGVGVAALCLSARTGASVTGLEVQPRYADLARQNACDTELPLQVVEGDIADLPAALRAENFDHVMLNPPYFPAGGGTAAADAGRETANREQVALSVWLDAALRRLSPGGSFSMIARIDRLPEALGLVDGRLGALRVLPLAARHGTAPKRFVLQGRKGRRAPFALLPAFVLHAGLAHASDRDDHTPEAQSVLRDGRPLMLA